VEKQRRTHDVQSCFFSWEHAGETAYRNEVLLGYTDKLVAEYSGHFKIYSFTCNGLIASENWTKAEMWRLDTERGERERSGLQVFFSSLVCLR